MVKNLEQANGLGINLKMKRICILLPFITFLSFIPNGRPAVVPTIQALDCFAGHSVNSLTKALTIYFPSIVQKYFCTTKLGPLPNFQMSNYNTA